MQAYPGCLFYATCNFNPYNGCFSEYRNKNVRITHNVAMTGVLSGKVANIRKKSVPKHLGMEFALIIMYEV